MADVNADEGIALYRQAIDMFDANDRHHLMGDVWRAAIALMVKSEKFLNGLGCPLSAPGLTRLWRCSSR
jgi:hypothetical protein